MLVALSLSQRIWIVFLALRLVCLWLSQYLHLIKVFESFESSLKFYFTKFFLVVKIFVLRLPWRSCSNGVSESNIFSFEQFRLVKFYFIRFNYLSLVLNGSKWINPLFKNWKQHEHDVISNLNLKLNRLFVA